MKGSQFAFQLAYVTFLLRTLGKEEDLHRPGRDFHWHLVCSIDEFDLSLSSCSQHNPTYQCEPIHKIRDTGQEVAKIHSQQRHPKGIALVEQRTVYSIQGMTQAVEEAECEAFLG